MNIDHGLPHHYFTNEEKHSPIEPDTPLQPVKDEAKGMSKQIMEILLDNIHFSPQVHGYVVHGVVEKMIELFKEWHNKLSSPPEPSSKEQEGESWQEAIKEADEHYVPTAIHPSTQVLKYLQQNYSLYKKKP